MDNNNTGDEDERKIKQEKESKKEKKKWRGHQKDKWFLMCIIELFLLLLLTIFISQGRLITITLCILTEKNILTICTCSFKRKKKFKMANSLPYTFSLLEQTRTQPV